MEESPPLFDTPWHFHPEYELILIENSSGRRFMGDHMGEFSQNELVLIGPNLPHFWTSDSNTDMTLAKAFVIHFRSDFLGERYFQLPEMVIIRNLLEKAQTGLRIKGATNEEISKMIRKTHAVKGFERLLLLQQILYTIGISSEYELLSSPGFMETFKATRDERTRKVYEYVMHNFKNKIDLKTIASIANMSSIGFCRYFKNTTGKSFFNFLIEIRIGYACRLLIEGNMNITQICYESGFNNLSHFNRQFKKTTKQTPQLYREAVKNKTTRV